MKIGTMVLSLVGVAVLSVATVRAEGEATQTTAPAKKADFFAKLDTDANGTLSLAEFKVMHEKRIAKQKAANPDATVVTAEEAFAKLDADKNGSLTKEELMAGHKRGAKKPAAAPVAAPAP